MKVLHLTAHEDTGAGRAALRLHQGLLAQNIDSVVLTARKTSNTETVIQPKFRANVLKELQQVLVGKVFGKRFEQAKGIFSFNLTPSLLTQQIKSLNPDIINLHWIGWEFLKIEDIQNLHCPIVWTLHDMWTFTGGCHYSADCDRYTQSCGACPLLASKKEVDVTRRTWQRKAKAWKDCNLTLIAPSQWMADCAHRSSLFANHQVEVIPHGLDIETYKPIDQSVARAALNLPQDKQLVLFGALRATDDPRKGFHLLQSALHRLNELQHNNQIELVVFGSAKLGTTTESGFTAHHMGQFNDDLSLALVYSAADVMVVPSMQESFGQTASESLACGTPVVAFDVTGLKDIIDHHQNGYLAQPYTVEDLARGIEWILEDHDRHQQLRHQARNKVEKEFTLDLQAIRYSSIFKTLLNTSKN